MVFQQFNLWSHMTVLQNVMEAPVTVLGRDRAEVEAAARGYLDKVGIGDKADAWPAQLSGGQQQRAAIARALCMEPRALLFDEPTSALDPELEQEVVRVIKALADEGRTMLLVTHDMKLAADCLGPRGVPASRPGRGTGPARGPVRRPANRPAAAVPARHGCAMTRGTVPAPRLAFCCGNAMLGRAAPAPPGTAGNLNSAGPKGSASKRPETAAGVQLWELEQ